MLLSEEPYPALPMIDAGQEHLIYGLLPARVAIPAVPAIWHFYKRVNDLVLGLLLIVITAPVVAVAALAILAVSPGWPIFAQARVGKDGRIFRMYKLRTMVNGAHLLHEKMRELNNVSGPVLKIKKDPRLISIGPFLRRYSIDELPNLWNVLMGDMSLVGPRPPLPKEVAAYDTRAFRRLTVKPGVTCIWQISGRSDISFDRWIELDNQYIDSWSPILDFRILAATVPAVFRAKGAY
jgi:lipopolysaccharide/colanic/teichoic acid biosynthesis glycosyltransferase